MSSACLGETIRIVLADKENRLGPANIVGENTHFVMAMLPVADPDLHDAASSPGKDKTHRPGAVVRDLLDIIDGYLPVRVVYADREFYGAEAFAALENYHLFYVIPSPDFNRVKTNVNRVTVKQEHVIHGPVKHKVTNTPVETTIVVLPPDEKYDDGQVFATNLEVNDEIGLDRRRTREKIERYQKRAGIETAYSKIKEFGGMTTSRSFSVWLFHFGMGVLLYNMWLLVDFLVQVSMEAEVRSKPRVVSERFREFLKIVLRELLPG